MLGGGCWILRIGDGWVNVRDGGIVMVAGGTWVLCSSFWNLDLRVDDEGGYFLLSRKRASLEGKRDWSFWLGNAQLGLI